LELGCDSFREAREKLVSSRTLRIKEEEEEEEEEASNSGLNCIRFCSFGNDKEKTTNSLEEKKEGGRRRREKKREEEMAISLKQAKNIYSDDKLANTYRSVRTIYPDEYHDTIINYYRKHNGSPFSHLSSHLISSHLISSHLISSHLISSHLISSHLISSHLISSHLINHTRLITR